MMGGGLLDARNGKLEGEPSKKCISGEVEMCI